MEFVPTQGTRITGQHKDKKQRLSEALCHLRLVLAGVVSLGEGRRDGVEIAQIVGTLARACSVFLRKLVLGEPRDREARLLDDNVLASLNLRLQPLRRVPRSRRRTIETGAQLDAVRMVVDRLDESTKKPVERHQAVGGVQGVSIVIEWPLPGMADWVETPSAPALWGLSPQQLFDTRSDRAMQCSDWLSQQVVMFDQKGITLEKLIRTVANFDGAHAVNVGRLMTVDGEKPSKAAKDPEVHILRNITFFGIGYAELIVVEAALYLYSRLLDEPSIKRPVGEIHRVAPAFECPAEESGSGRPAWLGFRGGMILSFSAKPGVIRHTVKGVQ